LNQKIIKEKGKGGDAYYISKLKKKIGYGNKKQKGTYSFIDFTAYKAAREIESQSKGRRAGDLTHLEVALMSKGVVQRYLGDTKNMNTARSIIDNQYNTYTFKVQLFEANLVLI
jgi:hypothetical protein